MPYSAPNGGKGLAVTSMICGIVVWVLCCGGALVGGLLGATSARDGGDPSAVMAGTTMFGLVSDVIQFVLDLVAIICGWTSLAKRAPGKGQAITGVVLGGLHLLLFILGIVLMLVVGVSILSSLHSS
jgi:hypothetical protein